MPFGGGNRVCIGERFALIEAKIALAKFLLKFKFDLDRTRTSVPLKLSIKKILLQPEEGIFIKLEKL
jgi:cytochrome P450